MREPITITTSDNIRIAGHWYPVERPKGWALLLHMMPAMKESYVGLAEELQRRGIASLAIDFRGHGESQGGPKGYEKFSDADQQAKSLDIDAAHLWISERVGANRNSDFHTLDPRFVVVGASIGANLALKFAQGTPTIAGVVLLSPGRDYRGVHTDAIAQKIVRSESRSPVPSRTAILLAAGGSDDEYSTETVRQLAAILGERATVRTFTRAGHGTTMFEREPAFLTEVADWIEQRFQ